jgi:hypothetical protein
MIWRYFEASYRFLLVGISIISSGLSKIEVDLVRINIYNHGNNNDLWDSKGRIADLSGI